MKKVLNKYTLIILQMAGFLIVALGIWLDEGLDLPHHLFGAAAKPMNIEEAVFESLSVILLGAIVAWLSWKQLKRITQLEKLLPICSFCKKIRQPDTDPEKQESWIDVERYINKRTGSDFSHGLCPECLEKHYGIYLK